MEERLKALELWRSDVTRQLDLLTSSLAANTKITTETNTSVRSILKIWETAELGGTAFNWIVKVGCGLVVAWASWKTIRP